MQTKDIKKVKDIIYKAQNEFCEELDFDYDYNGRELTEDDLNMLEECVNNFSRKLTLLIDDEFPYEKPNIREVFNDDDIEVFKQVLKDFDEIKCEIDTLIIESETLEELKDKVLDIYCIDEITNYEENNFIDYIYRSSSEYDMFISILQDKDKKIFLSEDLDIWVGADSLGLHNVSELEDIISEYENGYCCICGEKKEDFESAYCDKCWKEEQERLGGSNG